MDNVDTCDSGRNVGNIYSGYRMPPFVATGHPSILSVRDANRLVDLVNLIPNVQVKISQTDTDEPNGEWIVSDTNIILDIELPQGSGGSAVNVVVCQVISETLEYVTCQPIQYSADGVYAATSDPTIKVAKPLALRAVQTTAIQPQYVQTTPQVIWALQDPTGGTGVYVSGADVGYLDLNVDCRTLTSPRVFTFLKSLGDYFLTGQGIAVAKSPDIRCSIGSKLIYGTVWAYTYPHNPVGGGPSTDALAYLYRVAKTGSGSSAITENQGLVPQLSAGNVSIPADKIVAEYMPNGTGVNSDPLDLVTSVGGISVPIKWQMQGPHMWAKFANQGF